MNKEITERLDKIVDSTYVVYEDFFYMDLNNISFHSYEQQYIYFICCGHNYIKIGRTNNINSRLKALQTSMPVQLKVIALIAVSTNEVAYELEKHLHQLFQEYRLQGEWFEFKPVYSWIKTHDFNDVPSFQVINEKYRVPQIKKKLLLCWITDSCDVDNVNFKTNRTLLYRDYLTYCNSNKRTPLTRNTFYQELRANGFYDYQSHGTWFFRGIALKESEVKHELSDI